MVVNFEVTDPTILLNTHKENISEDIQLHVQMKNYVISNWILVSFWLLPKYYTWWYQSNINSLPCLDCIFCFTPFKLLLPTKTLGLLMDSLGETDNTFLINLFFDKTREHSKICIGVVSFEIYATLLPGGRTVHSAFKVPLNLTRR